MDFTVISTYRCNSKCSMCYIWQNPTHPADEISIKTLQKVPFGIDNLNITGGEPTLRNDLFEMVEILYPKARKLEISSNGLLPERLEAIIKQYPDIKIRFSLEGFADVNNFIRGEKNGFEIKAAGLRRLQELGGRDLGFAIVIQDENVPDLIALYRKTQEMGVELATSTLHNAFQFHKNDNYPYDRVKIARVIEKLILEMLKTGSVKNWFRAYLNLGLIEKVLGHDRLIPCTAGADFIFVDPWSDVYACNVRPDLKMGNLADQSWQEIYLGEKATEIRNLVAACKQNCWMVGTARAAMRHPRFSRLPKWQPFQWVLSNKMRVTLGLPIQFDRYVDYDTAGGFTPGPPRSSFLGSSGAKRTVQRKDNAHYKLPGGYDNR
jgi:MoaA/NifB/PqqE/SkfB family radical SAM enzyme